LPSDVDEERLIDAALAQGVRLDGIADAYLGPRLGSRIIFGYGSIDEQRIAEGIATVASLPST